MDTHPTESEGRMRRGRGAIHARVTRKTVFALLAVVCALLFTAIPSPNQIGFNDVPVDHP